MHLLFVIQESGKIPSGVVSVVLEICQNWRSEDRITVCTNRLHWAGDEMSKEFILRKGFQVKTLPFLLPSELSFKLNTLRMNTLCVKSLKAVLKFFSWLPALILIPYLSHWMKNNKIDVIFSHNGGWPGGELNRWVLIAGKFASVKKNILVIHNLPANIRKVLVPWNYIMNSLIGSVCTDIITVSNSCKISIENDVRFGRDLKVIKNGIRIKSNIATIAQQTSPPWQKNGLTIGFVGELHPRKGVHVLMKAFQMVKLPCELVLIGVGEKDYTRHIEDLSRICDHSVYFLGYREDASVLYQWLDIVVLPSLDFESFGMVLIEAMSNEKPVICSDFGGMKEVVDHEKTGLVVPRGDSYALKNALERLINDDALMLRMGKEGRKRQEKDFNSLNMTRSYEKLLNEK